MEDTTVYNNNVRFNFFFFCNYSKHFQLCRIFDSPCRNGKVKAAANNANKEKKFTKTALILFEDIDVVLGEQDDGFYSAVNHLISSTKRPIILTTSDEHFSAKKLLKSASAELPHCFRFKSVPARTTAQYLRLLSLAEGFPVELACLEKLVTLNRGVISRSIQDLQYWAMSGASGPIVLMEDIETDKDVTAFPCTNLDESLGMTSDQQQQSVSDSLERLLSLNQSDRSSSATVKLQGGCSEAKMGLLNDEASKSYFSSTQNHDDSSRRLFAFRSKLEHFWAYGLGEFYDSQKYLILPFPRFNCEEAENQGQKKEKYANWIDSQGKKYKRIRKYDNSVFTTEGSSSEEEEKEEEEAEKCKVESEGIKASLKLPKSDLEKRAFQQSLSAIQEVSRPCEISSLFHSFPDDQPWWVSEAAGGRSEAARGQDLKQSDLLQREIAQFLQTETLQASCDKLSACLKSEPQQTDPLCIQITDSALNAYPSLNSGCESDTSSIIDKTVLDQVIPDLTLCIRSHILDTLPIVRNMVRYEEIRKAGKGAKVSRSGRFTSYLERQEIFLPSDIIPSLCTTFL